jgi:hypothetical protein
MPDTKKYIDQAGVKKIHDLVQEDINNHHDSTKQDTLVSGTNIKTINGEPVLGDGNIKISTNATFHSGWNITGTTEQLHQSIIDDDTVKAGDSFLGTLSCSDLPGDMIQAEAIISIISDGANGKAISINLTSVEVPPYE